MSTEIETVLLIVSPDAAAAAAAIAALPGIGTFTFRPEPTQRLRDVYVDTAEGALFAGRLAMRLRWIDGEAWVGIKGPSTVSAEGVVMRREVEAPWSSDGLGVVLGEIRAAGVPVAEAPEWTAVSALDVLGGLGLRPVQVRDTKRQRRAVLRSGEAGPEPLAELAIDAVVYRFDRRDVRLYQVEIEMASPDASVAPAVAAALRARCGSDLRPWPFDKLRSGMAIEALLADGSLDPLLSADGALLPEAAPLLLGRLAHATR
jgi:inorganic triphosphatase YgiF